MWLSQQNPHLSIKTEFNFMATVYRHTQYLSIPSVSSVNLSASLKGNLHTLQSHSWNNGINGGINWAGFAPNDSLTHWCVIGHCVAVMAAHVVSQMGVLPPPTHPIPPHPVLPSPTIHPTHPLYYQYGWQKRTAKIPRNSAIRDSYNKSQ